MPYVIVGEIPKIDTSLIPPLEGRLLGKTFFESMERFYADPENRRRCEEWKKARREAADKAKIEEVKENESHD